MTLFWLLVWMMSQNPLVNAWNTWAISLGVCIVIDFLGVLKFRGHECNCECEDE